jgi:threonine aldolase
MRQSGILAAAGLYGLDHHVERLADDHVRAQELADGLSELGMAVEDPETNMVFFDPTPAGIDAPALVAALAERGVRMSEVAGRIRAVTHLDVDESGIERALATAAEVVAGR